MVVQAILMDMEFDNTIDKLMEKSVVKTSTSKEHVGEIDRINRTVKQRNQ